MRKLSTLLVVLVCSGGASRAFADSELTFFGGAGFGGSFTLLAEEGDIDLETAIKDSPMFGLRVGGYGFPFGFEGSLTYSPSGLSGGAFEGLFESTTNILYAEANVLLIILPGPVQPFVTGGLGLHYLDFNIADLLSFSRTKLGYNYGGGLKVNISRVSLRVDVRDHITTFGLGDLGLGSIGGIIGLGDTDTRIHNVELTFGVGIRF